MKLAYLANRADRGTVPLTPLSTESLPKWLAGQPARVAKWVESLGFKAEPGGVCLLPAEGNGGLGRALAGIDPDDGLWSFAGLPAKLPVGRYSLDGDLTPMAATEAALGWGLGTYEFSAYRQPRGRFASLVWPKGADKAAVRRALEATYLVRDLVNTPAEDMGPAELAAAATRLARAHSGKASVTVGDALLKKNYPMVHAVGRASTRAPRLIDLRWGREGPAIVLVGKGVCFDTGGLDLKSAAGMKLMKKDMGGAAHVLGLAGMIMAAKLRVRLRVLVPAVDNSVSGNAIRPLDVVKTRKGLTVEIGNTDAEGRLILCDALTAAEAEHPDLVVDFATLTGAARVALGTELPAMFCNNDEIAEALLRHGRDQRDPVWRMPLHAPYRRLFGSKVADLNNISGDAYGGAIIAALFLAEFVDRETPWVHFDVMAWNPANRPGRPEGGEAMGMRATYALIEDLARGGVKGGRARPAKRARRAK